MYNSKIKIRTVQRPIAGASKPDRLGAFRQPPFTIEGRPSYLRIFHIGEKDGFFEFEFELFPDVRCEKINTISKNKKQSSVLLSNFCNITFVTIPEVTFLTQVYNCNDISNV